VRRAGVAAIDVAAAEALEVLESPYGSVGLVHAGSDLTVWWIRKADEDIDPSWLVLDHEDFLYVVEGQLALELRDDPAHTLVLSPGQACVVPPSTPMRGYRHPRDGPACVFLAVSAAGAGRRQGRAGSAARARGRA
jgi:mannose-6-phosphate isomerase-like protein (cupin superfamily)